MAISRPFLDSQAPTRQEQLLLTIMGVILPPAPLFVMTGPHYTIKTKEFAISCLLTVFPRFLSFTKSLFEILVVFFIFWVIAVSYTIWFIFIGYDKGRNLTRGYVGGDLEVGLDEDNRQGDDITDIPQFSDNEPAKDSPTQDTPKQQDTPEGNKLTA